MRFRKRISIAKGIGINVSKSGLSMSAGIPGLSVTAGKRGVYMNAGIPGTGIYDRQRIGGGGKSSSKTSGGQNATVRATVGIHVDDQGNATFTMPDGSPIQDLETIGRIKRMPEFKEIMAKEKAERTARLANEAEEKNNAAEDIINIGSQASVVRSAKQFADDLASLRPKEPSALEPYDVPAPDKREISAELERRGNAEITSMFSKKKKVMMFVCDNLEKEYAAAVSSWEKGKVEFEKSQLERQKAEGEDNAREYEKTKEFLTNAIQGEESFIVNYTEEWLGTIRLPLDFGVDFDYVVEKSRMLIDLDLPEIEDLPDETVIQQANGQLKTKKKTQARLQEDYAKCVFGFALFFASNIFNISPAIDSILISGYTQRRDKVGDIVNEYIYSIDFLRSELEGVDLSAASPMEVCMKSKNRCNVSKTFILKAIEPFDA